MRRYVKKALIALMLTVIVSLSALAIATRIQGGKLLSVQTKSMVPVLKKGDLVSVKSVPAQNLKAGDIITFINQANKKQTITHRIVALPETSTTHQFVTKGDANLAIDQPIAANAIVGKLRYSVPLIGYFSDFIRQPLGLALIIYVPALAIIVSEMKRLAAYYRSQQNYIVPWRRQRSKKGKERASSAVVAARILPFVLVTVLLVAVPVHALLRDTATLTGNTISATRPVTPPPNPCTTPGNSTTITVTGNGSGNVNVSNSNNQNAQTGNATSTNGGNATSGNATNCNNTNINITVTGH